MISTASFGFSRCVFTAWLSLELRWCFELLWPSNLLGVVGGAY